LSKRLTEKEIIGRKEWGALPPRAPRTRSDPAKLKGVVVHWFGSPKAARTHRGCAALLRSVQKNHMKGEFIDIAYSMAVCPHGKIYRARGFRYRTGANGTAKTNIDYGSVVWMGGVGDTAPTPEAKKSIRRVIDEFRRLGAGKAVRTHGSITGSECPGPHLTKWVEGGAQ